MNEQYAIDIITRNAEETEAAGRRLGEIIRDTGARPFIALYGDLGAGKTVFVRGLAAVLSPGSRVKSPTYTLVNEYRRGPVPLFHFDLYRIAEEDELDGFGFEDYVAGGICAAEWSERLGDSLPPDAVEVRIEKLEGDERRITVRGIGEEKEA